MPPIISTKPEATALISNEIGTKSKRIRKELVKVIYPPSNISDCVFSRQAFFRTEGMDAGIDAGTDSASPCTDRAGAQLTGGRT